MWGVKQRRIRELKARVRELEEILCPCQQHDEVIISREVIPGNSPMELTYAHVMQCKRCKKIYRTFDYS